MTRTAYLHIPFCRSKCLYCDFYSSPGADEARLDAYTRALLLQIGTAERAALSSVYFGGGTPAVLGTRRLTALLDALAARFSIDTDAEVTLELNPNSLGCAPTSLRCGRRASTGCRSVCSRRCRRDSRRWAARTRRRTSCGVWTARGRPAFPTCRRI